MEEMIIEYISKSGLCIVRISDSKYYYGNGEGINAIGISANQFLRFNPYMEYIADKREKPNAKIQEWIKKNG